MSNNLKFIANSKNYPKSKETPGDPLKLVNCVQDKLSNSYFSRVLEKIISYFSKVVEKITQECREDSREDISKVCQGYIWSNNSKGKPTIVSSIVLRVLQ